jgi:hypothetical protein
MIPIKLTLQVRGAIMNSREIHEQKRIETKIEVSTYLEKLRYALNTGRAKIEFQEKRLIDALRDEKYTNRFTISDLFPDENPVMALKRELANLAVENYIETVKDLKFKNRSEMRVFGKKYSNEDVYIKIRIELLKTSSAGVEDYIFVMSFHYATRPFKEKDFVYGKK